MVYGDYRVLRQHAHGSNALRVWVEHVHTGERSFHVVNLNMYNNQEGVK